MRNIWTLRNNLILRKTGTSGIRGLTEYTEDCGKLFTPPVCQASGKTINSIELLKVMDV